MTDQNEVERSKTEHMPTEHLRELLDERGIEHKDYGKGIYSDASTIWWTHGGAFRYKAEEHVGVLHVFSCCSPKFVIMTPEQAITATVGKQVTGDTSDGYHTFNELYHHRAMLFSVVVSDHRDIAWKSRKHHDGTMYDDMFIIGVETPWGQATYHYDVDPYWDMFNCKELERAPEWDGHTPDDAIERIGKLATIAHSLSNPKLSDNLSDKVSEQWNRRVP